MFICNRRHLNVNATILPTTCMITVLTFSSFSIKIFFNNAHIYNCSSSELTWSSEIYLYSCLEVSAISRRVSHTLELAAAILAMDSFFLDPFFPFFLKKQVLKKNYFCLRFFCIIHIWLIIIPQKIGLILVYILAL